MGDGALSRGRFESRLVESRIVALNQSPTMSLPLPIPAGKQLGIDSQELETIAPVAPEGADAPGRPPKFTRGRFLPCGSAFMTKLPATSHDTGAGEALQEAGGGDPVGTEQWAQPVSNTHGGEKNWRTAAGVWEQ